MRKLALVPFYFSPQQALLAPLADRLARSCGLKVHLHSPWFDPEEVFDFSRGQYHSTRLLEALLHNCPPDLYRILGVTGADLFIPVLTHVFGEAQLNGKAAVVSFHRLQSELYGLPPDAACLQERLCKEALHELGHTFGLLHCRESHCVMHASTYVEDIDLKSCSFCSACAAALS